MASKENVKKATIQVPNVKSPNSNPKFGLTMSSRESHLLQLMARAQKDIEDLEAWIKIQEESSEKEREVIIRTFDAYKVQIQNMQSKFTKELEKKTIDNLIFVESQIREKTQLQKRVRGFDIGDKTKETMCKSESERSIKEKS